VFEFLFFALFITGPIVAMIVVGTKEWKTWRMLEHRAANEPGSVPEDLLRQQRRLARLTLAAALCLGLVANGFLVLSLGRMLSM